MLPPKIDLTEQNDFGERNRVDTSMDTIIPPDVYHGDMSYKEYLVLSRWEGVFGKSQENEKYILFKEAYGKKKQHYYENESNGVKIRIPWKTCQKCYVIINNGQIPWKKRYNEDNSVRVTDVLYNLFNSK